MTAAQHIGTAATHGSTRRRLARRLRAKGLTEEIIAKAVARKANRQAVRRQGVAS